MGRIDGGGEFKNKVWEVGGLMKLGLGWGEGEGEVGGRGGEVVDK